MEGVTFLNEFNITAFYEAENNEIKEIKVPLMFREAIFENGIDFSNIAFNRKVVFERARIQGNTKFEKTSFKTWADFRRVSFEGFVNFKDAHFDGWSHFTEASFKKDSFFDYACFGLEKESFKEHYPNREDFDRTAFTGWGNFTKESLKKSYDPNQIELFSIVDFAGSKFQSITSFIGTKFISITDFSGGEFKYFTWFIGANFIKLKTDYGFICICNYSNRKFEHTTRFSETTFDQPPFFHNSILHPDTDFNNTTFNNMKNPEISEDASRAFRVLKLAMEQTRDLDQ